MNLFETFLLFYVCVFFYFTEMAERHKANDVLALARNLVLQLQTIIENK